MKVGLYFGSFNPIHIGHFAIANYMIEFSDLDELWFVISPHNPLKKKNSLLNEYDRLKLVELAIGDNNKIKACDIEFRLPKPSFTIDTLTYLSERNPTYSFVLIAGTDNFQSFHKWKNYEEILKHYEFYIYPRPGSDLGDYKSYENIKLINAPLMEISSSFIRESIKNNHDIRYFLPNEVYDYILKMNLYK
ncbi:MAG: nicotinic acid mononucleotide adenylyltransferase [Marinilabiliales bacterium]|nr:MAG: nicotinic acid mononucleotide adenylyltransferase [Marinilabiliales bacterium]